MKNNVIISNLTTGYKQKQGTKIISKELNLSIRTNELVLLMGPNGCGKSTLMNTISGLLKPIKGEVTISNHLLKKIKSKDMSKLLSLVLTDRIHAPQLTVQEVVEVGRYPYVGQMGILSAKDKMIIKDSIERCNLVGYEHRFYVELSDGEKQRVMIARALTQDTPLMLLDEPTAHLDLPSRLDVMMMLRRLTEETNKTVLVSTHELDIALQWADTIWLMAKGGEVFHGSPEDLILNGHIEKVFGNNQLKFDPEKGEFSVIRTQNLPISIKGEGLRLKWTIRALERKGFSPIISHSEDSQIDISEHCWKYNNEEYLSLRELLIALEMNYEQE